MIDVRPDRRQRLSAEGSDGKAPASSLVLIASPSSVATPANIVKNRNFANAARARERGRLRGGNDGRPGMRLGPATLGAESKKAFSFDAGPKESLGWAEIVAVSPSVGPCEFRCAGSVGRSESLGASVMVGRSEKLGASCSLGRIEIAGPSSPALGAFSVAIGAGGAAVGRDEGLGARDPRLGG